MAVEAGRIVAENIMNIREAVGPSEYIFGIMILMVMAHEDKERLILRNEG